MIELRLGTPIFNGTQDCPSCTASALRTQSRTRPLRLLDTYGHHATICSCDDGSTRRHNALRNRLYKLLSPQYYSINARSEWRVPQDAHKPEGDQRSLDIYVHDPSFDEHPHAFDVSVVSPHSRNTGWRSRSSTQKILQAASTKERTYRDVCSPNTSVPLHPMIWDVYGRISSGTVRGLQLVSDFLSSRTGRCPASIRLQISTILTCLILRYTALSVNRRRIHASLAPLH